MPKAPNTLDSISEQESKDRLSNNTTEQEVWVEHNYWCMHVVGRGEKEERGDQLALRITMWWNKNKQVTSKEKQFIWIKIMCCWISDWDPWVDSECIVWNAFREIKAMKVIFRTEINFP